MPIQFKCPHCETTLRAPSEKAGGRAKCKKCSQVIRIPMIPRTASTPSMRRQASVSQASAAQASVSQASAAQASAAQASAAQASAAQASAAQASASQASANPGQVADELSAQTPLKPQRAASPSKAAAQQDITASSSTQQSDDPFADLPEFQALSAPVKKQTSSDAEFHQLMMSDSIPMDTAAEQSNSPGQANVAPPPDVPSKAPVADHSNIADLISNFDETIQNAVVQQQVSNQKAVKAKFTVAEIRKAFTRPLGDVHRLKGLRAKQINSAITVALVPLGFVAFVVFGSLAMLISYKTWMFGDSEGVLNPIIGLPFIFACVVMLFCWIPALNLIFAGLSMLFSGHRSHATATQLTRESQPVMYEFVDQICEKLGSPKPCRIDLDCEFNASASLRRGWFSSDKNDLVLTIGIPFIAVQNTEQLASVIAHEFGHFRQGSAMKTYYIIGRLTHWFISSAQSGLAYFYFFGYLTHRLSGSLSREMEWDADRHAVHLAGTKAFVESSALLERYGVAYAVTIDNLIALFHQGVLVDNVPRFMMHIGRTMPAATIRRIAEATEKQRQDSLDSHPPTRDRVNAARELNQSGILSIGRPATDLIDHWAKLCKKITLDFYTEKLDLAPNEIDETHVTPLEDILREEHKLLLDKSQ